MTSTADSRAPSDRMPVLYLSHGAPPLADDPTWTAELASWSADLPRPTSILMVSAHWEEAPLALSATTKVPLVELFPEADIPVLQMSMPTLDPQELFEIGRKLAPVRDQGTLIVGSGFTTHNLRWFDPSASADAHAPTASTEFDAWAREAMAAADVDSILDFLHKAPAAHEAHPRTEHFAPLFVSLGAAYESGDLESRSVIDGFWYGLSKRSWQFT